MAELKLEQGVADELAGGEATALFVGELPGPGHQLEGHHLRDGVAVGSSFGEDVPDGDEESAGDGDDGDLGWLVAGEAAELGLPVRGLVHCDPGGFNEDATEVAAAAFGDAFGAMGLAGVVDASAEAGIADEVFGGGEAGDVADGGEDGHSGEEAEAGELDQEGDLIFPRGVGAEAMELSLQVGQLVLDVDEGGQGLVEAEALGGGKLESSPPVPVVNGEGVTWRRGDVVAVEDAVELVLEAGLLFDQLAAMSDECA